MRKLLLVILGPFFLVASLVVGFIWWDRGAPPGFRPKVVDVTVAEINREHRGVRVDGTAHYPFHLSQRGSSEDAKTWHVFPMFAKGDTMGREIQVLVRTQTAPDEMLGLEDRVVEGLARPPGRLVTSSVREAYVQRGYSFAEKYVLVVAFDD